MDCLVSPESWFLLLGNASAWLKLWLLRHPFQRWLSLISTLPATQLDKEPIWDGTFKFKFTNRVSLQNTRTPPSIPIKAGPPPMPTTPLSLPLLPTLCVVPSIQWDMEQSTCAFQDLWVHCNHKNQSSHNTGYQQAETNIKRPPSKQALKASPALQLRVQVPTDSTRQTTHTRIQP